MTITTDMRNDIIEQLKACEFRALCDKYFGNDFLWTIRGSSELSGTYTDIDDFFDNIIARLNALLLPGWKMHILDTFVDGDTMIVEMKGEVTAKSGNDYNNEYCWIFKFGDGVLKSITAYYDSLLVNKTLAENE